MVIHCQSHSVMLRVGGRVLFYISRTDAKKDKAFYEANGFECRFVRKLPAKYWNIGKLSKMDH